MRKVGLYLLIVVVIAIFLAIPICGTLLWNLSQWVEYSPGDYPLAHTKAYMQAIVRARGGSMPDRIIVEDFDSPVIAGCWQLLQTTALRNNNLYRLENPRIYGDYGTHVPGTGSDEVIIEIVFPDGKIIEMYYYNAFLESCEEITADEN